MRSAFAVFSENGIGGAKTIDIAKRAGVSHGTVFAHFATKEELAAQIVERYGKRVAGRIHELVETGSSLKDILEAHLEGLAEYESFYFYLVAEGPLLSVDTRDALIGIQSAISFHLSKRAEVEMRAGTVKRVPVHILFNSWMGLVHHYVLNRDLFAPGDSVLRRRKEELCAYFMDLIRS